MVCTTWLIKEIQVSVHLLSSNVTTISLGQGKITSLISQIFNVNYDYFGTVLSNLAKVSPQWVLQHNIVHMYS